MDAELVGRCPGPVVISALAGAPGQEYRTANGNGVAHFRAAGAADVVAAPDVRVDRAAGLEVLSTARLLVLPGGSPSRLLIALQSTPVGQVVADLLAAGGLVMGSSAGAMVLCAWTVLPDRRGPDGPAVVPGLGVVPDLVVVPHWNGGSSRADWVRAVQATVPAGTCVLGIPEESGVLVEPTGPTGGRTVTALGQSATRSVLDGRDLAVGQTWNAA